MKFIQRIPNIIVMMMMSVLRGNLLQFMRKNTKQLPDGSTVVAKQQRRHEHKKQKQNRQALSRSKQGIYSGQRGAVRHSGAPMLSR